eukprot:CAMPEP_0197824876 /NCGR_PEP_ID=MMETSP1437-20131217/2079_1 /TAXON_ID=49252 ORGANISM="Eucampia antarctica, Strain CCMP1452" /NCGR_SAMPLE_ID=MMETSP1437 /ASSEMBLY_ACC=CAM_ASM_001096 /LENGTH=274 /DNA_ID=CAMNT_0043424679 /DNA_START=3 /DNA_END=827 /DNA_ORIENTATION=-
MTKEGIVVTSRPDGRDGGGKLRPLSAELSTLTRADGSAKFCAGSTTVLAAVYGPVAPRMSNRELPDRAMISVVWKQQSAASYGATERELERFVVDALTCCIQVRDHPRTVIQVVLQVITADGSVLSTAINAAVMAILDTGIIAMKSMPIASTILLLPSHPPNNNTNDNNNNNNSQSLCLDPVAEEESSAESSAVVLVTTTNNNNNNNNNDNNNNNKQQSNTNVVASMTFGPLSSLESYLACIEAASRTSQAVVAFIRLAMEQKVTREAQTLWSN